ncbi:hypothetical protein GWI33_016243 [Rhynchophorus ferrugineus]|uniref:Clip domain-containing protein n=1 Tax=Rhynchophorus ferrugineus TaxID=354439 RepID=A0A834IBK2_RHYFE|nr:hypothetical protein GWI33_016243 [Rhynchophorus ferrugineus]
MFSFVDAADNFNAQTKSHSQRSSNDDKQVHLFEPVHEPPEHTLFSVLRKGYVKIGDTTYDIGQDSNLPATEPCTNPFYGSSGKCTRIPECLDLLIYKTTIQQYVPHFCKIGSFAGVCCPQREPFYYHH